MSSSNIGEPVRVGDYIAFMSYIKGRSPGSSDPLVFYIQAELYYREVLASGSLTDMDLMRYADFVIDLNDNKIIKCRAALSDLVDAFITRKITDDVHC